MRWSGPRVGADRRAAVPLETTFLFAFVVIVGLIVGAVAFGYIDLVGQPTTVPVNDGECSYSLEFDPRDVAEFADSKAQNDRYTDGTFPCVLWLDASQSRGFAPGEPVRSWQDKSSNGFAATPTAEAPEWAVVDGVEAVRFDGSPNSSLAVAATPDAISVTNGSGLTVTMLVYVIDKDHRDGGLYAIGAAEGADMAIEMRQSDEPPGTPGSDEWWAEPGPSSTITTEGEWAIITHTTDGETGTLYVNGENLGSDADAVADLGSEVRIGAAGSGRAFNGLVAEYFVSNERLSTANRNIVQCAMDAKHGYVVGLDAC